jgi:cytoskeletal protein CcmA (bactofilin family)
MWKRENEPAPTPPTSAPQPANTPRREAREPEPSPPPPVRTADSPVGRALVGPATVIRGELAGEEDLLVEGRIEGKIDLKQNAVTIGAKGRVSAEILARAILIDGEVEGNLIAEEQITIRRTGRVRGDLVAPRVTIEDGARFKGSIDMEPKRASTPAVTPSPRPAGVPKTDPISASLAAAVGGNS